MMAIGAVACAQAVQPPTPLTPTHELTVPNFDDDSPSCVVKVPVESSQCTSKGCTLAAPAGSTLDSIKLGFRCGPKSAPTGFENPAPDAKVQSFRAKNAPAHLSLADGVFEPPTSGFGSDFLLVRKVQ
jgi:hypothetical protein